MTRHPSIGAVALRRLLVLARDLLQAADLKSVIALVGPVLQELLLPDGTLLLVALGDEEFVTEFGRGGGLQPAREESTLYRYARYAMDSQTPVLLPDVAAEPAPDRAGLPAAGAASLLALPFPPIRPLGVICAFWYRRGREHQLAERIATLRYLGELTGAALGNVDFRQVLEKRAAARDREAAEAEREHARELERRDSADEEIRRISVIDVMTGMFNRRGFFLHAEQSFKLARRRNMPSALIFADIDRLKAVNAGLGHDAGDRFILDAARILRGSFRDSDIVARLGGDEFAAFTLDAGRPEAILARIEQRLEEFHRQAAAPYRLSFSTSIVQCDPAAEAGLQDYVALADRKMDEFKKERPA